MVFWGYAILGRGLVPVSNIVVLSWERCGLLGKPTFLPERFTPVNRFCMMKAAGRLPGGNGLFARSSMPLPAG